MQIFYHVCITLDTMCICTVLYTNGKYKGLIINLPFYKGLYIIWLFNVFDVYSDYETLRQKRWFFKIEVSTLSDELRYMLHFRGKLILVNTYSEDLRTRKNFSLIYREQLVNWCLTKTYVCNTIQIHLLFCYVPSLSTWFRPLLLCGFIY